MKKGIVRILNLGYLAACAVSIWAICTQPIFKTAVNLDMTSDELGTVLAPLFLNNTDSGSDSKSTSRVVASRDAETKKQVTDYITAQRIADAFKDPQHPENDGIHLTVEISVPAKYAFDLSNTQIINELVVENIDSVLTNTCEALATPLTNFVFSIAQEFAIDALTASLDAQIKNALGSDASISDQEVQDIYDNVYAALSSNDGSIPLESLTNIIIHGNGDGDTSALTVLNDHSAFEYVECDPKPTEEQYNANPTEYFVLNAEEKYVNPEAYNEEATYYTYVYKLCDPQPSVEAFNRTPAKYFVLVDGKYINNETYSESATYYERKKAKEYTQEDLDRVDIEAQMEDALKNVPGLVENEYTEATDLDKDTYNATLKSTKYYLYDGVSYAPAAYGEHLSELYDEDHNRVLPNPLESEFNKTLESNTYYVFDGNDYLKATNVFADGTVYYTSQATVKDIDTALVALLNEYLLKKGDGESSGDGNKAIKRDSSSGSLTNAKSKNEVNAALKEFAYKYIPLERVTAVNDSAGKLVPFVLLTIVLVVGFPWALLALVTFIRTLRRDKVWTKPWIVIVLAAPQVLFGLILTYGLKYGLALAAKSLEIIQKVLDVGVTAELQTICLVPSFVYFIVVAYSIIYAFFAHGAKVQYKLKKRAMRRRRQY